MQYRIERRPLSEEERKGQLGSYVWKTILHWFAFVMLEGGFIGLGAFARAQKSGFIVISSQIVDKYDESNIRGCFIASLIAIQSIASMFAGRILADAFSREWTTQRNVVSDRVSTATSSFVDYIWHLFGKSSKAFKAAFASLVILTLLTVLAPGMVSISNVTFSVQSEIQVGKIPQTATDDAVQLLASQNRAHPMLLELMEGWPAPLPYGWRLPPNTMMALPPAVGLEAEYETDIVKFQHDCRWEAPTFKNGTSGDDLLVSVVGREWTTNLTHELDSSAAIVKASSISPLYLADPQLRSNVSTSAYLFAGGNAMVDDGNSTYAIDLGSLPASIMQQGVGLFIDSQFFISSLVTTLVCDPRIEISPGRIHISNNGTVAVVGKTSSPSSANSTDFSLTAAHLILSTAFNAAINADLLEIDHLSRFSSRLFLGTTDFSWENSRSIPPLNISTLNKNFDTFMSVAAKAFVDGYRSPENITSTTSRSFDLVPVPATTTASSLALKTSIPLFSSVLLLFVSDALFLLVVCLFVVWEGPRYRFDIKGIRKTIPGAFI